MREGRGRESSQLASGYSPHQQFLLTCTSASAHLIVVVSFLGHSLEMDIGGSTETLQVPERNGGIVQARDISY